MYIRIFLRRKYFSEDSYTQQRHIAGMKVDNNLKAKECAFSAMPVSCETR